MPVEVQIYCRRPSLGEMRALIDMGVQYVAWHVKPEDGKGLIQSHQIAAYARARNAKSSLLIHSRKISELTAIIWMVKPDYLLLSSERDDARMPELAEQVRPHTQLMMSVPVRVSGSDMQLPSLELARTYEAFAGCLILDTCPDPSLIQRFGCTGRTNDWTICAEIVANARVPVILAGGLNKHNVRAAISQVKPDAVDACTALELPDKSKDLIECKAFYNAAMNG